MSFTLFANDPDGDTIRYSVTGPLLEATLNTITGVFTWTPDYTQAGIYVVTFTATAQTLSDSETITIMVNNVDRPPVLTSPGDKIVDEEKTLTFTLSATDPDGDAITYSMMPILNNATLVSSTGVFNWTPTYEQSGSYIVTFTATAKTLSDSKSITIRVNNIDRPPVLVSPGNNAVDENKALTFTLSAADPDGGPITYSMIPALTGAALDSTTGFFKWTPDYKQSGNYVVTCTATAQTLSDSKSITITVNNIDRPPVLVSPANKVVTEKELLTFTVSAIDPDGDPITYSGAGLPEGANLNANTGVFTWTPGFLQAGKYVVTFTATAKMLSDFKRIMIKAEPPPAKWSGTIEGIFSNTIGQLNTSNTTLKSDTYGDWNTFKLYFGLLYLRGKTNNALTSFQRRAEVKGDRKLTANFYGYLQQVFDANQITLLDMGSRASGGLGYHFAKSATFKESVDIGSSYNSEEYDNLTLRKRTYSYQSSNTFYWKITTGLELFHRYEYLPNTSDLKNFRTRSDGSLKIYIGKHLYSNFGMINEYDSAPASAATPKHKATILTTIGFKF